MTENMTSRERIARTLKRLPVDRIGVYEDFWKDTEAKWKKEGHVGESESLHDHFGLDIRGISPFYMVADIDFEDLIVEETEETRLIRNGNGALLRWHKLHSSTPEHVDFLVKERGGWNEHIRPRLLNRDWYRRRIKFQEYRDVKKKCDREELFFVWQGINVFELMHPVCGHENMLAGMALDPEWVKDMCAVYSELIINLMEILFSEEGKPDGIWFWEDMGYKLSPFMSPAMYREIIWPAHKRTFDYAHSLGLPVIVHSCGFIEPLVGGLIEAGMDCLQAIEVKAGMDLLKLKRLYGDRIAFMGGIDARALISNDLKALEAELKAKVPYVSEGGGYCLHSDHSIPDQIEYETYKYFVETGIRLGRHK
jgi:uroporphyrinogen decarboxylase